MNLSGHTFHIPVMGLAFTIDTPVKVARFGISSVISIIEDGLVEQMRKFYSEKEQIPYHPITKKDHDHRARRITGYLNLVDEIVQKQMRVLREEPFTEDSEITRYFQMLPDNSDAKQLYQMMLKESDPAKKLDLQNELRTKIVPGAIDVNIMTKCDRINFDESGEPMDVEYADAMAALRGFALSKLSSSVVFSAGMNPRLYAYCESFSDFLPDSDGNFKKKIILKVSDYRSALIQGKFLAKKGLWISEFRIESGLNCGGHAFPTNGYLLGPILDEFKTKRTELTDELFRIYQQALESKNIQAPASCPSVRVTVQGGIGTHKEDKFLLEHYQVDGTGWGSPFLLVPEATNVDDGTLNALSEAAPADFFLSHASPLGVPFNNFRRSTGEQQRVERFNKGRPGSPCYKKYLAFNTEFSKEPICTSSREYLHKKFKQVGEQTTPVTASQQQELDQLIEKDCLCEGLAAAALIKNNIPVPHNLTAVSVCPGPNLAYFSGQFKLKEMVDHIYGRINILNDIDRPSMFVNELRLYVDYLKKEISVSFEKTAVKQKANFEDWKSNLLSGINYYTQLIAEVRTESEEYLAKMNTQLNEIKNDIAQCSFVVRTDSPVMAEV
jgi:hypothetical protein